MISGSCEDEWSKFDLTIPYPIPQPFDFGRIPQRVRMFCRRPPDVAPPPPDSMEIDRYPTPPVQERQITQQSQNALQPENDPPLFYPEDDRASLSYFMRLLLLVDFDPKPSPLPSNSQAQD